MANPWHDSQGRFCSPGELDRLIRTAALMGDFVTYERERANKERIEKELEAEARSNPNHIQLGGDEDKVWEKFQTLTSNPQSYLGKGFIVSGTNLESFGIEHTYETGRDNVLDVYSAATTVKGLDQLKAALDMSKGMHEGFTVDGPNFTLFNISMLQAPFIQIKREEAKAHRAWRREIIAGMNSLETEAERDASAELILNDMKHKRVALRVKVKEAKFNYLYLLNQVTDTEFRATERPVAQALHDLQKAHDVYVFHDLKVRELEHYRAS